MQIAGEASLAIKMVPVNAVTAILLAARPEDDSIKLQAPCSFLVDVTIETEDQNPLPYEAAAEGLRVHLSIPHGTRSKVIQLEPVANTGQGAITFSSGILTSAGR